MMLICIKQHLSNIWSSLNKKVKHRWDWVAENRVAFLKNFVKLAQWPANFLKWGFHSRTFPPKFAKYFRTISSQNTFLLLLPSCFWNAIIIVKTTAKFMVLYVVSIFTLAIACLLTRDKTLFWGLLDHHIITKAKAISYTTLTTEIYSIQKRRKNTKHALFYYHKFYSHSLPKMCTVIYKISIIK